MADTERTANTAPASVTFHYIKGQNFKTIHVDGAIGGITPRGLIHVAIYSERQAIPQMVVHDVSDGVVGKPTETIAKPGIVREMEADLIMDRDVAQGFVDWLNAHIAEWDKIVGPSRTVPSMRSAPPKSKKRKAKK